MVSKYVNYLEGTVIDNWKSNCTILTVKEILLTSKVLCAIVEGIPIVTLKYWEDFVENVKKNLPPPDTKQYIPPCAEAVLSSKKNMLTYQPARKELFRNKMFVFLNNTTWKQMQELIFLAGKLSNRLKLKFLLFYVCILISFIRASFLSIHVQRSIRLS